MNEEMIKKAITLAYEARNQSYAPYSKFKVGAYLVTKKGKGYQGCNIENAAYTPSNCAERTAFFKAISEGEKEFLYIAIVGGYEENELEYCSPCGVCRQVMAEFCNPEEFQIIVAKSVEEYKIFALKELFPESFGPENL